MPSPNFFGHRPPTKEPWNELVAKTQVSFRKEDRHGFCPLAARRSQIGPGDRACLRYVRRRNAPKSQSRFDHLSSRSSLAPPLLTRFASIEASAVLVSSALRYLPVSRVSAEALTQALRSGLENAPVPVSGYFPITREIAVGDFENDGESLAEARVRERFGVTVVTVNSPHGDVLVNPPAGTTIKSGDKLRVFGLPKQIAEFQAYVNGTGAHNA